MLPSVTPVAATKTSSHCDEVVGGQLPVDVEARVDELLPLLVVARPEPSLHRAAQALDRGCGDHAFRRAADAHQQIDAPALSGGRDRRRDIAVRDQLHLGAHLAELRDQVDVAVAVEHDDRHVLGAHALRLGRAPHVLRRRGVDVDDVRRRGPTTILSM